MLVPRPSGKVSFQLVLTPYNHGHSVRGEERRLWLVEIADPSDIPSLALQLIARLYHLTPAEARLAEHLLRGATVQEVAGATGVKVPTIRSQLSTLLRKTGTRRQAELIRMLSVVPA